MTSKKNGGIAKCVKILEEAAKVFGSIPHFHRELVKRGIEISDTALYNAHRGVSNSLKPHILVAILHLVYKGNEKRFCKDLEADYMPPGLK